MDSLQLLTLYLTLTPILSGRKAKINLHTTPKLTVAMPIGSAVSCHARIQKFSSGGGGGHVNLTKKNLTTLFVCFCFFLVLSLFYKSQMVNFKEKYHFQGSGGGLNFSRGGGVQLFPGGGGGAGSLLIPYRNPYNL